MDRGTDAEQQADALLLVFPICHRDYEQALNVVRWMGELQPSYPNHKAFVVGSLKVSEPQIKEVAAMFRRMGFSEVSAIRLREEDSRGWPWGPNMMFRTAAEQIQAQQRCPFLWCEPDLIPLKEGWLDAIESEYLKCGKPYMGAVFSQPWTHLVGVAVYPANIRKYNPYTLARTDLPFDTVRPDLTLRHTHITNLIQHEWGDVKTNTPLSFKDPESVSKVRSGAVIFHRCKDGSLIEVLRGGLGRNPKERTGDHWADYVSLRRNGDIICILPMLRELAQRYKRKIRLVVHSCYESLLEGVSYVEPVLWNGHFDDPIPASLEYQAVNLQAYGMGLPRISGRNFAKLSWSKAGYVFNRHLQLVFDKRNLRRENTLVKSTFKTDLPKVLLNFTSYSSPFPHGRFLLAAFNHLLPECEVVDLSKVKAERIYDLIGLMDRATCLVTADTATLWLCHASPVPCIQLVNDSPWGASPPRGNVIMRLPYAKTMSSWKLMLESIRQTLYVPQNEDVVLVHSDWTPKDAASKARNLKCSKTWKFLKANRTLPFSGKRTSSMFGDPRSTPFVRDMIESAMATGDEEIVVITNNDIVFDPSLGVAMRDSCRKRGCYWAYRIAKTGAETDEGADCFAFTRKWWLMHQHQFPDFLLGFFWWDDILIRLMRWSGCDECRRLYYHEPHDGAQSRPDSPGQKHNLSLALAWLKEHDEQDQKPLSKKRDCLTGDRIVTASSRQLTP